MTQNKKKLREFFSSNEIKKKRNSLCVLLRWLFMRVLVFPVDVCVYVCEYVHMHISVCVVKKIRRYNSNLQHSCVFTHTQTHIKPLKTEEEEN